MSVPTNAGKEVRPAAPESDQGEQKKTILIYSPDLNFCFSLSMLFQDRYTVITSTNLGTMDRLVSDYAADLVLIDAVPSQKLVERIGGLRSLNNNLPIMVLYVYNERDTELDKVIRTQVDAVFYKPLEIAPVSKRIDDLLSGRR